MDHREKLERELYMYEFFLKAFTELEMFASCERAQLETKMGKISKKLLIMEGKPTSAGEQG